MVSRLCGRFGFEYLNNRRFESLLRFSTVTEYFWPKFLAQILQMRGSLNDLLSNVFTGSGTKFIYTYLFWYPLTQTNSIFKVFDMWMAE